MGLEGIIGHDQAKSLLLRALREDRVPHALMLVGPEGVGKGTLARGLGAALLCGGDGVGGCGTCLACRRVAHGNHPDFLTVTRLPKKPSDAGADQDDPAIERRPFIVVDQIREMAVHAGYPPLEGRRRVVLVDPADRMNAEAQNALLKTLEEPPSRTVVVLTATRVHGLLPTVRSRCLTVALAPLPTTRLAGELCERGMAREEAEARAALAAGRPGRALSLDLDNLRARREALLADLEALSTSTDALGRLPDMASRLIGTDDEEFVEGLDLVQGLLRDAAIRSTDHDGGTALHLDLAGRLGQLGERLGRRRAAALVESIEEIRARGRFHVNRTYSAEALLAAVAGGPPPGPASVF